VSFAQHGVNESIYRRNWYTKAVMRITSKRDTKRHHVLVPIRIRKTLALFFVIKRRRSALLERKNRHQEIASATLPSPVE
jgi:hypothetical protein